MKAAAAEEKKGKLKLQTVGELKRKATPQPPEVKKLQLKKPLLEKPPIDDIDADDDDEEDEDEEQQEIALPEGHISLGEFKGVSVKHHYGNTVAALHKYQVHICIYTYI